MYTTTNNNPKIDKNCQTETNTKKEFTSHGKPKAQSADSIKTVDEIHRIKEYLLNAKQYRNHALFICGISFGCRCGDLLKLKFENIFDEMDEYKEKTSIKEEKTGKERTLEILPAVCRALDIYIEKGLNGSFSKKDFIFKSQKGINSPLTVSSVCKIFKKMAKELNLKSHCSTHFLRKTFAYMFLQAHKQNTDALVNLQTLLNHSTQQMTLRYCGESRERMRKMLEESSTMLGI